MSTTARLCADAGTDESSSNTSSNIVVQFGSDTVVQIYDTLTWPMMASPWYNRRGWLGVKKKKKKLITMMAWPCAHNES